MAVRIRLARYGAKKHPVYRIVAADAQSRRDGRFIEQLGAYDPNVNPPKVSLERDRYDYWLANGALPSETVARLTKGA